MSDSYTFAIAQPHRFALSILSRYPFLLLTAVCFLFCTPVQSQPALPVNGRQAVGLSTTTSIVQPTATVTYSSSSTMRCSYTFVSPITDNGASPIGCPSGLETFRISGMRMFGYTTQIGAEVKSITLDSIETVEVPFPNMVFTAIGERNSSSPNSIQSTKSEIVIPKGIYPPTWFDQKYIGRIGSLPVSQLKFYPYRYDPSRKSILWAKKMVVRIETVKPFDVSIVNNIVSALDPQYRLAHRASFATVKSALPQPITLAPDGKFYKFSTKEDGFYRVTGKDLIDLGVPLASVDTRTMKLYRNGAEIPMYISDRSNSTMNESDYFEFFGERKKSLATAAISDLVNDLHTVYSTYFFVWGGSNGKRIVEESGSPDQVHATPAADLTSESASFPTTLHFEQDESTFFDIITGNAGPGTFTGDFDIYFWKHLRTPFVPNSISRQDIPILLPDPNTTSNEPVAVKTSFRGTSISNGTSLEFFQQDHIVETAINNQSLSRATFTGDGFYIASSDTNSIGSLKNSALKSTGEQVVTIQDKSPAQDGKGTEDVWMNWFDVSYQRLYRANNNRLDFRTPSGAQPGYYQFMIRNFTKPGIRIFRKGISFITNTAVAEDASSKTYTARFQVYAASGSETFVALSDDRVQKPEMRSGKPLDLWSVQNDGNYVVIVDDSTSDYSHIDEASHPLQKFKQFREREGEFKVKIVRATDIYDLFNNGDVHPDAIRNFLSYAYHNWQRPPLYAFIVSNGLPLYSGDTSLKSQDTFMMERSYIPSMLFQGPFNGATQCDYYFGCIDGVIMLEKNSGNAPAIRWNLPDPFAEVSVGRLCVGSIADTKNYVDKLIRQEGTPDYGEWRNRIGMIAGPTEDDTPFNSFAYDITRDRLRYFFEPYRLLANKNLIETPYYNPYPFFPFKTQDKNRVFKLLNDTSLSVLFYLGHGGPQEWDASGRLNTSTYRDPSSGKIRYNVDSMTSIGRMPTIFSFSCNSGALRFNQSLMAEMMICPVKGPVSGFGADAFSFVNNNQYMADAILTVLTNPKYRNRTIGEQMTLAKARYSGLHLNEDAALVQTMNGMCTIYGDPACKIPMTRDTMTLHSPNLTVAPGSDAVAQGVFPFTPSRISVTVFDSTDTPISREDVTPNGSQFSIRKTIPSDWSHLFYGIRVYAWDNNGNSVTGSIRYATINASLIGVHPVGKLFVEEPAVFQIHYAGPLSIDSGVYAKVENVDGGVTMSNTRMNLTKLSEGVYQTEAIPGTVLPSGSIITVSMPQLFFIIEGRKDRSYKFLVPGGPDAAAIRQHLADSTADDYETSRPALSNIPNETIRMVATTGGAKLHATLYNWGGSASQDVPYSLAYFDSLSSEYVFLDTGRTVTISPYDSTEITATIANQFPFWRKIDLIAGYTFDQRRKQNIFAGNDVASFWVSPATMMFTPQLGFTRNGATAENDTIPSIAVLSMQPNSSNSSGIVSAVVSVAPPETPQSFSFVKLGDASQYIARTLSLRVEPRSADTSWISMKLWIDKNDSLYRSEALRIVRYDRTTKLWTGFPTQRSSSDSGLLSATVPLGGEYAVVTSTDSIGPEVIYTTDGRPADSTLSLSANAKLDVVITDRSGVNTDDNALILKFDNSPLTKGIDYQIVDSSATPNSINVRLFKSLPSGAHTICVQAADKFSNTVQKCVTINVVTDAQIKFLGTFPNPFRENMFFAYNLEAVTNVDEVELKLFSTAGKLVRTMAWPSLDDNQRNPFLKGGTGDPTRNGYHEIWWEGLDNSGVACSNGVYFYRLRLKSAGEIVKEYSGAIARIR